MTNAITLSINYDKASDKAKKARSQFAKGYSAIAEIADIVGRYDKQIKAFQAIIDTDMDDLEKLDNGESGVIRDRSVIESELATKYAELKVLRVKIAELKEVQVAKSSQVYEYISKEAQSFEGLDKFLTACDFAHSDEDVNAIAMAIGFKTKTSSKGVINGELYKAKSHKAFCDMLIRIIAQDMLEKGKISTHKFTKDAVKYAEKKATKNN